MSASQKNWALLANYLDHAKVNTHLAYTPRRAPVRAHLDTAIPGGRGRPQWRLSGLYQLCDLVRMESGRLDEDPPDADTGSGLTGTYLLEADNKEQPGYPGESDDPAGPPLTASGSSTTTPEDDLTAAQIAYIQGYIDDFETALYGTGFADPDTGWRAWADEASFVDWYIVQELFANSDSALWSSCKMWKARDGKLHMGPLWDFDLSLGEPRAGTPTRPPGSPAPLAGTPACSPTTPSPMPSPPGGRRCSKRSATTSRPSTGSSTPRPWRSGATTSAGHGPPTHPCRPTSASDGSPPASPGSAPS